jgi:hypothetical protein
MILLVGKFVHETTTSSTNITRQKRTLNWVEHTTSLDEMDLQHTQQPCVETEEVSSKSMAGSRSSVRKMSMSKTWTKKGTRRKYIRQLEDCNQIDYGVRFMAPGIRLRVA